MNFSTIIIPSLNAVLEETWDFTYILYHEYNGTVETLKPLIKKAICLFLVTKHLTRN